MPPRNNEKLSKEEIKIINNVTNQIYNLIQNGENPSNAIQNGLVLIKDNLQAIIRSRLIPIEVKEKIQQRLSNLYAKKNILNHELIQHIIEQGSEKNLNGNPKCLENKNVNYRNFKNKLQGKIGIDCALVNSVQNFRTPDKRARSNKYKCITPSLEIKTNEKKNHILNKIISQDWLTNQFQTINEEILETPNNLNCSSNVSSTKSIKSMPSRIRPINNPHYRASTQASEARSRPSTAPKTLRRYGGKKRTTAKSKKAKKRVQKK